MAIHSEYRCVKCSFFKLATSYVIDKDQLDKINRYFIAKINPYNKEITYRLKTEETLKKDEILIELQIYKIKRLKDDEMRYKVFIDKLFVTFSKEGHLLSDEIIEAASHVSKFLSRVNSYDLKEKKISEINETSSFQNIINYLANLFSRCF